MTFLMSYKGKTNIIVSDLHSLVYKLLPIICITIYSWYESSPEY